MTKQRSSVLLPLALAYQLFSIDGATAQIRDTDDLESGDYELLSRDALKFETWPPRTEVETIEPIFIGTASNVAIQERADAGQIHRQTERYREPDAEIKIENGIKVPKDKFPGLFRKTANTLCTLVLVGPRAAIGAAHCFSYRATDVHFQKINARGKCYQHPRWPRWENDLALCGFDKALDVNAFETLNIAQKVGVGQSIVMMGYGCTSQGGSITSVLRMGRGTVSLPQPGQRPEANTVYVTSDASKGEAALCSGDSGGPTFQFEGGNLGLREIVGINSRVDSVGSLRYSYVTSTGTPENSEFIRSWVNRYGFKVCGVNLPNQGGPCLGF